MTTGAPTPAYSVQQPVQQPRPRRSRLRTFLPLGFAAWLVLEIWLLSVVAGAAGGFALFVLLLAGLVLGAVVTKRAGRRAFQNLNEAIQRGTAPTRGGGNGLMMLGGLLLMIPGLVSDAAGLLLLLPPVQKAVGRYTQRTVDRKLRDAGSGVLGEALQQARIHRPDGKVVQGEVVRDDNR
ncbi:FxsA family membrane protein [Streptomyces sp. NPDC006334]|uniref:FxsA family membrane protein n=1 Tax=Streptomyces sp. NPDC006334 TaxID=3156754 RepID=UPI0033B2902A